VAVAIADRTVLRCLASILETIPETRSAIPGRPPEQTEKELERCQARPAAARRGFREDVLCASYANTTVEFRDQLVPVCRMHEATYKRWGKDAECNAAELWEWPA
jgi:hypothetical protein